MNTFSRGVLVNNPAWAQLLGLCPLLAVSNSVVNALGWLGQRLCAVSSNLMIRPYVTVFPMLLAYLALY